MCSKRLEKFKTDWEEGQKVGQVNFLRPYNKNNPQNTNSIKKNPRDNFVT